MRRFKVSEDRKKGWKELPIGAILEAGTAKKYKTGDWRSNRPVWNEDKCINCLRCWIYCPDSAIMLKDGKVAGIDLEHCKGCGICSEECPVKPIKAITMVSEKDAK
jgi:pyruvate ferredoxin oxidoreductase delta subunit